MTVLIKKTDFLKTYYFFFGLLLWSPFNFPAKQMVEKQISYLTQKQEILLKRPGCPLYNTSRFKVFQMSQIHK